MIFTHKTAASSINLTMSDPCLYVLLGRFPDPLGQSIRSVFGRWLASGRWEFHKLPQKRANKVFLIELCGVCSTFSRLWPVPVGLWLGHTSQQRRAGCFLNSLRPNVRLVFCVFCPFGGWPATVQPTDDAVFPCNEVLCWNTHRE